MKVRGRPAPAVGVFKMRPFYLRGIQRGREERHVELCCGVF